MTVEIDIYPKDDIDQKLQEFNQKLEKIFDDEEEISYYKKLSDCIKIRIISLREIYNNKSKLTVKIDDDGLNIYRCII